MKRFLLIYGSQTGQSQAISEQIAEKATSKGFEVDFNCLDQSGIKVSKVLKLVVNLLLSFYNTCDKFMWCHNIVRVKILLYLCF